MRPPVIDHQFRYTIVKVAVDPQTTTRTMLWPNLSAKTGQKHEKLTSICLYLINYECMYLSAYWQWKLANKHARIFAAIVNNEMKFKGTISSISGNWIKPWKKEKNWYQHLCFIYLLEIILPEKINSQTMIFKITDHLQETTITFGGLNIQLMKFASLQMFLFTNSFSFIRDNRLRK